MSTSPDLSLAINGYFLAHPFTGSGRYTDRLLANLPGNTRRTVYALAAQPPPTIQSIRLLSTPFDRGNVNLAKLWFEQVVLPRAAAAIKPDLAHYPYFAAPMGGQWIGPPVVTTVHDLIPLLFKDYRTSPAVALYTRVVSAGVRRARMVITDSDASRRDIRRLLGIPDSRIRVIPLAADERYTHVNRPENWAARVTEVRKRYGLDKPYALYLGSFERRKNVPTLVAAFQRFKSVSGCDAVLALCGPFRPNDPLFNDPHRLVAESKLGNSIRYLGTPPWEDAPALYAGADVFVFPSLYEGFGLPPLEAMACGTAVICSKRSSLPEVVGEAGILIDPESPDEIAEALSRILTDPDLRERLGTLGGERARQFSWQRTAELTRRAYEEACQ